MLSFVIESVVPLGRRTFYCIVRKPRPNVRVYRWRCDGESPAKPGA
jgi:hypothetical protein